MKDRLALIDADSIVYSCSHQDTDFDNMKFYLDETISRIASSTESNSVLLFTSTKSFRHGEAKFTEYKGNRKKQQMKPEFYGLFKYMDQNWNTISISGYEADDLVIIFQEDESLNNKFDTIVCSIDKDVLMQSKNSFNYKYGKEQFHQNTKDEIIRNIMFQTLMGDSTDNIKGVEGVGPKKAEKLLKDVSNPIEKTLSVYINVYGELEGIERFYDNYNLVRLLREIDTYENIPILEIIKKNKELLLPKGNTSW